MPLVRPTRQRSLWRGLKNAGLVLLVLVAGVAAQTLALGELFVAGFAVYALTHRIASRITFVLALIAMVPAALLQVTGRDPLLGANFAVYAFLLLAVGVVMLAREVRRANR